MKNNYRAKIENMRLRYSSRRISLAICFIFICTHGTSALGSIKIYNSRISNIRNLKVLSIIDNIQGPEKNRYIINVTEGLGPESSLKPGGATRKVTDEQLSGACPTNALVTQIKAVSSQFSAFYSVTNFDKNFKILYDMGTDEDFILINEKYRISSRMVCSPMRWIMGT